MFEEGVQTKEGDKDTQFSKLKNYTGLKYKIQIFFKQWQQVVGNFT